MSQQWFKFYGAEYLSDPKIFSLNGNQRSCWVTLLSLASTSTIPGEIPYLTEERLFGMSGLDFTRDEWEDCQGTLQKFVNLEMIKIENEKITILNFKKRQEVYLTNAERQAKYRERQQDNTKVTLMLHKSNARIEENRIEENRIDTATVKNSKELKKQFFENPLMQKIQETYPDRDDEFQFDLMCDWWLKTKKKLPQNLSAMSNWLKNTKPDELIQAERRRKIEREDAAKKQKILDETPRASEEKLQALRNKMKGIGKSI